jgi:hypothetical protein
MDPSSSAAWSKLGGGSVVGAWSRRRLSGAMAKATAAVNYYYYYYFFFFPLDLQ